MARPFRLMVLRFYHQASLTEVIIIVFLFSCFFRGLIVPNWRFDGYTEINFVANFKCDFHELSENVNTHKSTGDFNFKLPTQFNKERFIENGGKYVNKNCKTDQNVAIIIPYRNRREHLQTFIDYIHPYLIQQNAINYQVFVIEQDDLLPFNRGNLLNIGYFEALQLNPDLNCFIFHDVDILPSDLRQLYTCSHIPRHLCSYLDKFRYVLLYPELFGGAIAIHKEQFAQTNGYSNEYSGWGGEDDDFFYRVKHNFGYIERYSKSIGRCRMLSHHQNNELSESREELLQNVSTRALKDGLTSLNQTYVLKQIEYFPSYVKVKVSLHS